MLARHFLLAVLALMTGLVVIPDASAQTTYTVCSKQGSELDLNRASTSGMRAKLSNTNYFGPGGTVAPEQMAFQSLSSVNSGSLAACDIFIGGGFPENLSVAETQAIRTWVNSGNRFVIAGCDSSSQLLCGPNGLQRSLTNISSGFGVSLNFSLAYNPLTCGGVSGVDTYGGAATVISSLAGDATLATHNGTYTGQPAAIAPDLVAPEFLMTADPDMYGSSGNGVIGNSAIASSDQSVFVLNSFKFAADALSGRLQNPQCPVDYNSAGDLEIGLTASAASVSVGGTVDFEIEVANTGGASVGDIEALFEVPAGFSFVSEAGPGSYDSASGVWTLGALNPGDSVTLIVTATAAAVGSPQARAEITRANLPDSDSAPNAGFGEDDLADGLNDDDEASLAMTIQPGGPTVSGRVFEDNGAGGSTAHDGVFAGNEAGIGGVRILARDAGGAVIARTESDGDGLYTIVLPNNSAGSQVTLHAVRAGGEWRYVSGAPGDLPAAADTLASHGEVSFTPVPGADYSGVDIGQVRRPQLKAPRLASLSPGQSVVLGHTFTATTAGTVDLTLSDIEASPASAFTQALFADTDCDGVIGLAETVVSGSLGVAAGDETCLLVRVSAAPGIPGDSRLDYTLMADFAYAGTALGEELANDDRVTVSPEGALELTKQVCNLTVSACDAASGTGFAPANTGRPGDVLIYRIGFENPGPDAIDEVDIHDDTPAYSRLTATGPDVVAAPAGLSCMLVSPAAPAAGYAGDLHWQCSGQMSAGDQGVVSFEVAVDE
jgi:hypothetical protein